MVLSRHEGKGTSYSVVILFEVALTAYCSRESSDIYMCVCVCVCVCVCLYCHSIGFEPLSFSSKGTSL